MRGLVAFLSCLLLTLLGLGGSGRAQEDEASPMPPYCHAYADVAQALADRYHEAPVSLGVQSNGNLLQVFASPASGTWTVVSTSPAGLACILAVGESWESIAARPDRPAA